MAQDFRRFAGTDFAPPLHHIPEGTTDPSKVRLPTGFVVVIAGASRGIGLGIAKAYARAQVSGIVLSSRNLEALEKAAIEVVKINPRVKILCQECDVTSEEDVRKLAEATKSAFGRLDVLVVNAGASTKTSMTREGGLKDWPRNFLEQPAAEMESLWRLHVQAPFLLMQKFIPLLKETDGGAKAVLQISSVAGHYVQADIMAASYSLTKMASTRLVELCHEGHKEQGIVAFAVQPGGVKTDLSSSVPEGKGWEKLLIDHIELAGAVCVWLTKEKRQWLSGRYVDSRWDFDELLKRKEEIVREDLLKYRMKVD